MSESRSASSRDATQAREILLALLETVYGSRQDACDALDRALDESQHADLPDTAPAVIAFVRAYLVPVLSVDLGPRLTVTLLDDFFTQYEIRSGVRAKRESAGGVPVARIVPRPRDSAPERLVRVALVDADRVGRTAFARALIRSRCEVSVVDAASQLAEMVRLGAGVDVAIVDALHPARLAILEALVDAFPAARLVVRSSEPEAARELLHGLGAARFLVRPRDQPAQEMLADALAKALADY